LPTWSGLKQLDLREHKRFQRFDFRLNAVMLALACLPLTMNAETVSDKSLFDFTSATHSPAWQIVNDDVMGGVSVSRFEHATNGPAIFSGEVSLEHNGGFASVRSSPVQQQLTGLDAFVVRVRGDGRRYKFAVRIGTGFDSPLYQCAFPTKRGEWQEHHLAFKDFVPTFRGRELTGMPPLDPARIKYVGFLMADKQGGAFRLEIAFIRAIRRLSVRAAGGVDATFHMP
jgi:hypothetical protein